MKRKSSLWIAGMAVLLLAGLLPEAGHSAPPPAKPPQAPATPAAPAAPSAAADSPLLFRFDPSGKPDPFKPFIDVEMAQRKKKAEEQLRLQQQLQQKQRQEKQALSIYPLQRLALHQFKLVGIAGNSSSRTAMVQDPAGKFYPLFIGTQMGLNGAKVVEIRESSVILEELSLVTQKQVQVTSKKSKKKLAEKNLPEKKTIEKKYIEIKLHQEGEEGKP